MIKVVKYRDATFRIEPCYAECSDGRVEEHLSLAFSIDGHSIVIQNIFNLISAIARQADVRATDPGADTGYTIQNITATTAAGWKPGPV